MSRASGSGGGLTLYEQMKAQKAAVKSKAKSRAKGKSAPVASSEPSGSADVTQRPSRHLGRRNTEEAADRAIEEQFPHTSLFWRMW